MIGRTRKFIVEVKAELGKAQWPWDPREKGFKRYRELSDSTVVVVVAMLLLGGYVATFDLIVVNLVGLLTAP
ncbi:SecE/Sec61-gamma subunits of protein translocation complex [Candidatus Xiphinematobacter sp. Idaho Grape]|uniref:preprotein translocase subunit SecE n=1 Tax=Candidatus Xiphinematobacter sp. Idaho Grape TaxID=1704307 RepID=UPI000706D8F6|nr:preprotein translocase subunit SecE [Candidatus Xiphinematobacter sp. Idaho Grape]ALJ56906.1 SecE/Sec61-gamma subunits of protein translocation complex [Candidatus Xiphinematobacter sp. Idaho Grape]